MATLTIAVSVLPSSSFGSNLTNALCLGTFSRMLEQANSLGYRLILPHRRLYPGSTPYTEEESEALGPNSSTEQNTKAFLKQGEYILLLVDNLIKELGLKKVILVGWSLATAFFCSMIYSITTVPEEVKARVLQAVKSIVLWGTFYISTHLSSK